MMKKEIVEKDLEKLESLIFFLYEEILFDLEKQFVSLDEEYEIIILEIFKIGEEWYRDIDIVINKRKNEIIEIKVKYSNILQK